MAGTDPIAPWLRVTDDGHPRRALSSTEVLEAAHTLVHESGVEALTLRNLASAVGASTNAIYRRIHSKERLFLAVADLVLSEVDVERGTDSEDWRKSLRDLSMSVRATLIAHPHVHPILASELIVTPSSLRIAEACVAALRSGGLHRDDLTHAYNTWVSFVFGGTVIEIKPANAPEEPLRSQAEAFIRGLDAGTYPNLAAESSSLVGRAFGLRWEAGPVGRNGKSFAWGLDLLLRSFEGLPARARQPGV